MPSKRKRALTKDDHMLLAASPDGLTDEQLKRRRTLQNLLSSRRSREMREKTRCTLPSQIVELQNKVNELETDVATCREKTISKETPLNLACTGNSLITALKQYQLEKDSEISELLSGLQNVFSPYQVEQSRTTRSLTHDGEQAVGLLTSAWMHQTKEDFD